MRKKFALASPIERLRGGHNGQLWSRRAKNRGGTHQECPKPAAHELEGAVQGLETQQVVKNHKKDVVREAQNPQRPRQRHPHSLVKVLKIYSLTISVTQRQLKQKKK